ncbi:hypothetical protein G9A89_019948 [Geosiphon pyriformis]|nr:hypothetical protein G9A89_019948 [Geosiphon pyriformis]
MTIQRDKTSGTMNFVSLVANSCLTKECGTTFLDTPITAIWYCAISCLDDYPHNKDEIWWMANAKVEGTMPSKILEIKNNPPEPVNIVLISNPDAFLDLEAGPEKFYKHYQNLTPTQEEQEQCLAQINT